MEQKYRTEYCLFKNFHHLLWDFLEEGDVVILYHEPNIRTISDLKVQTNETIITEQYIFWNSIHVLGKL